MKIIKTRQLEIYVRDDSKRPFVELLEGLKDKQARYRIKERLDRVSLGNMGDCKPLANANGVHELRCDFGPGYRLYYGEDGDKIILLLSGGDKSTQVKDIKKAIEYWNDYLSR